MIQHLPHHAIDKKKWDAMIHASANGLIYAESVYLDHMSPGWEALVLNDYEACMPLTWRRKWGIRYLCQPPFMQQTGIMAPIAVSAEMESEFIEKASGLFPFAEFHLNYANKLIPSEKNYSLHARKNFLLRPENNRAEPLFNAYVMQRVEKSKRAGLRYEISNDLPAAISLYKKLYQPRLRGFTHTVYEQFEKLCLQYQPEKRLHIRVMYAPDFQEPVAMAVFLNDQKRLYNMASSVTEKGRSLLANYLLYHQLIREFHPTGLILDFEGSDHPGIAYFYSKFSTQQETYSLIRWNHLPFWMKWLKS